MMASAARPFTLLSLELPTTTVCATTAMSPSLSVTSGSLFIGEKWQMQLLTETQQGNAMPFCTFLSFLNAFAVSSSTRSSHLAQISRTEAPATHMATPSLSTLLVISAAILYLVTTRSSAM